MLLQRYGVVARELALLDPGMPPWRVLYEVLSRLELAGEVRRGYFVEGLSGRSSPCPRRPSCCRTGPALDAPAPVVLLHSLDPANLYGSGAPLDNDPGESREQRHRLQPGARIGGRGEQQMIDGHRAVEAEVLGAPEIGAHVGQGRGARAERETGNSQAELHRRGHRSPSSFLASATVSPPTRAWGRPPSVTTRATRISPALGASTKRTSMASKWVRTKAASL